MFALTEFSAGFMYGRWILQRQTNVAVTRLWKMGIQLHLCMHSQVQTMKCYWTRWVGSCRISNEGCSEAILPFKPPVVKSAWRPVCFSWILFLLKLPGWREALSWECCSTCEVGCVCVWELGRYMCVSAQLACLHWCRRFKRMFGGADVQHLSLSSGGECVRRARLQSRALHVSLVALHAGRGKPKGYHLS